MKAESGNFINRIQNPVQPNTGYAPALGIWDQSIINDVHNGQMKYYRKGEGGLTTIDNGCPCAPAIVNETVSIPPDVPGPVRDILLEYGSVIVTWNAPNSGGIPTSYTVSAIPTPPSDLPTVTVTGVLTTTYLFTREDLVFGTEYQISVIGVNSFGNGSPPLSIPSIFAPYGAPFISVSQNSQVDQLVIGVNYNTRPAFALTSGTTFNIKMYINGTLQSTPSYTSSITPPYDATITVSGLTQSQYSYSFTVQIVNGNDYSSISSRATLPPPPPNVPYFSSFSTRVEINYDEYTAFSPSGLFYTGKLYGRTAPNDPTELIRIDQSATSTKAIFYDLPSNTTYFECYITLSNDSITSSPSNIISFIQTLYPVPIISINFPPTTTSTTVTIQYLAYTSFNVQFGELYDGTGTLLGRVSATSTEMAVVGNLSPNTLYNSSYIILETLDGLTKSAQSDRFNFRTQ
jgi:hypothetical protein